MHSGSVGRAGTSVLRHPGVAVTDTVHCTQQSLGIDPPSVFVFVLFFLLL